MFDGIDCPNLNEGCLASCRHAGLFAQSHAAKVVGVASALAVPEGFALARIDAEEVPKLRIDTVPRVHSLAAVKVKLA